MHDKKQQIKGDKKRQEVLIKGEKDKRGKYFFGINL
jgi:hypothetical protein